jgi:hypothetical protein
LKIKKFFGVVLVLVVSWNLLVFYVDYKLEQKSFDDTYKSCYKVWNSRGSYKDFFQQNTIGSITKAFKENAVGLEFDFHYDVKTNRFIIGHDHPMMGSDGELKYCLKNNGKILTMKMLFDALDEKQTYYFWLDYKNLDKLTKEQTLKSIQRLKSITKGKNLLENLYLEGSNPLRLPLYEKAGIKTIFGIHPLKNDSIFASITLNGYKVAFYFSDASAIAMGYGRDMSNPLYGKKAKDIYKNLPIFLFHVKNTKELISKLVKDENIRVILVNAKPSQRIDFKEFNSCK